MVLQPLAHLGRIVHHRDAVALQQRAGPDARELQQLRRIERAAAQNDFPSGFYLMGFLVLQVLDRNRFLSGEQNLRNQNPGQNSQVRALLRWAQVADRGARAPAVPVVHW